MNNSTNNEKLTSSINETTKIAIGQRYKCTTEGVVGFIVFNTETDFEMQIGDEGSENLIRKGIYEINENKIILTVKLDSSYMIMPTNELDPTFKEYEIKITIINNQELNYTTDFGVSYTFKLSTDTADVGTADSNNFLEEIFSKYPDKRDLICTNDSDYWLLDSKGEKVYFYDLESFEKALEQCSNKDEIVIVWENMSNEEMKKFAKDLLISKCKEQKLSSEYIEGIKENVIKEEILTEENKLTYIVMSLTPKKYSGQTIYHYIDTYILQVVSNTNSSKWKEYNSSEYINNNIFDIEFKQLASISSSNYSDSPTSNISNISTEDLNNGIEKANEKVNEYLNKN